MVEVIALSARATPRVDTEWDAMLGPRSRVGPPAANCVAGSTTLALLEMQVLALRSQVTRSPTAIRF